MDAAPSSDGSGLCYSIVSWDSVDVQLETDAQEARGTQKVGARAKVEAASVESSVQLVMDALHRRVALLDGVDVVLIEQQPAGGHNRHSNVRMKVVSHAMQAYFYAHSLLVPSNRTVPVVFVSPASKLKDMPRAAAPAEGAKPESNYVRNKKFAIAKAAELVAALPVNEANTRAKTLYESISSGKRDDMADSMLLAYYYLQKHVKLPKKRASKKDDKNGAAAAPDGEDQNVPEDQPAQAPKAKRARKVKAEEGDQPKAKRARKPKAEGEAPKAKRAKKSAAKAVETKSE